MAMMKFLGALLLAAALAFPAHAQNIFRPIPGPGIDIKDKTISTKLPVKDQSGGNYHILTGDNAFYLLVGAGGVTLDQAGSVGFPLNWQICFQNIGTANSIISTTTSIFKGAGESTTMVLAPGGWACPQSDGANWITPHRRGNPIIVDASQSRTLGEFDCDNIISFTSITAVAATLPGTNHIGCSVDVVQMGLSSPAGPLVTFTASGSGTRNNFDGYTRTAGQYAGMTWRVMANSNGSSAVWVGFGRGVP